MGYYTCSANQKAKFGSHDHYAGSCHHCKLKSPQWWKVKWIHPFYPAYPSGIRIPRSVNSFTHCLETLGTRRTQNWGLSLSHSGVISNYRVSIEDNSPPGCYGHILLIQDVARPWSVNNSTLEKHGRNNLPHNPPGSALGESKANLLD